VQAGVQAAYIASRMKDASTDPRFALRADPQGRLVAGTGTAGLHATFDERGASIGSGREAWAARLDMIGVRCGTTAFESGAAAPQLDPAAKNRVVYSRRAGPVEVTEWWSHGEPGLEQGFTVPASPCGASATDLVLEVAVSGGKAAAQGNGPEARVVLRDDKGTARAVYTALRATDAAGAELPASMTAADGRISLRIEVAGARWPVSVDPLLATLVTKLGPGAAASKDQIGWSVSVSGDTAVIGAPNTDLGAETDQGTAYVYTRSGTVWSYQQRLDSPGGHAFDHAGWSVAITGNSVLVGAPDRDSTPGANDDQGRVDAFERSGTAWTYQATLKSPAAAANQHFGRVVSASAGLAAVALAPSQGPAYVFTRSGTTWGAPVALSAGSSVAVDGTTALAVVGAPTAGASGTAYVWSRTGTSWGTLPQATVNPAGSPAGFGTSVAISGTTIGVGAPGNQGSPGAAYVYLQSGTAWAQQATVNGSAAGDHLGAAVALSGNVLFLGAPHNDTMSSAVGTVSIYVRSGSTWSLLSSTSATTGASPGDAAAIGDQYGYALSASTTSAAIGAPHGAFGTVPDMGRAYLFVHNNSGVLTAPTRAPPDPTSGARFGWSVSLGSGVAAIASPAGGVTQTGTVEAYTRSGTSWPRTQTLQGWGQSVLMNGASLAAAGATSGFAWTRSGTTWGAPSGMVGSATVLAPGATAAAGGLVAGAGYPKSLRSGATNRGAAFIQDLSWPPSCAQELVPPAASQAVVNSRFGAAMVIDPAGGYAVVGQPGTGEAHLYRPSASPKPGTCTTAGATCQGGFSVKAADGTITSCAPYACEAPSSFGYGPAGCRGTCGSNADCTGGTTCAATGECVAPGTAWVPSKTLSACDVTCLVFGEPLCLTDPYTGQLICEPLCAVFGVAPDTCDTHIFSANGVTTQAWAVCTDTGACDATSPISTYSYLDDCPYGNCGATWAGSYSSCGATSVSKCVAAPYTWVPPGTSVGPPYRTAWNTTPVTTITPSDPGGDFGASLALDTASGTLAVGAPTATPKLTQGTGRGAAYIFSGSATSWVQSAQIFPAAGKAGDAFGTSVSASGAVVAVGAPLRDGASADQGAAYLFVHQGTEWKEGENPIVAPDGFGNDQFGQSVAVSGRDLCVGSPYNGTDGAAYIFSVTGLLGDACSSTTDCMSPFQCADGVCCNSDCAGSCNVCTKALGAPADGVCTVLPAGSTGQPAVCAGNILCEGTSGACPALCASDASCPSGSFCYSSGTCVPTRPQGQACDLGECKVAASCRICATGHCTDNFCCDQACGGECESCKSSESVGPSGTCSAVDPGTPGTPPCAGGVLCDGVSRSCPGGCTSDAFCGSGKYCDLGTGDCPAKKTQGQTCDSSNQCGTVGGCVDGVCCNATCTAACMACSAALKQSGADGECGAALSGTDPHDRCSQDSPSSCGQTGVCAAAGGCATYGPSTVCATPTCINNESRPRTCAGAFDCQASASGTACSPFQCDAATGQCKATCSADADCVAGSYCSSGACVPKLVAGAACAGGGACQSGNCVDGVCCDTLCPGTCMACSAAKKGGGSDGQCANIVAGSDPDDECPTGSATTCGTTGVCSGGGACAYYDTATPCGTPTTVCVGNESRSRTCAGPGACQLAGSGTACGAFACSTATGLCPTTCASDADCSTGNYCDATRTPVACVPRKSLGSVCAATNECAANTFCADGVCCNSTCTGACQACTAALKQSGADGQCGPVKAGATDPACAVTVASTCGTTGSCDVGGLCARWASGTACGTTACDGASNTSTGQLCDGLGGCSQATTPVTCAPYLCGATACKTACTGAGDCVPGYYCNGGACVAERAAGATCFIAAECASGSCVDGVCCTTACAGTCMACSVARKGGGVDGECGAVAAGTDPDSECSADSPTTCGQNGQCDGAGACAYYGTTTVCGSSVCVGNESRPSVCTARLSCGPSAAGTSCGTFRCQASSGHCLLGCSADTDCVVGTYCDLVTSVCALKKPIAATCQAKNECLGGSCADGFCCDTACAGLCEACSATKKGQGSNGACGPIVAGSDPDDECATEAVTTCGTTGSCDGNRVCAKYGSGTDCSATPGTNVCSGNKAVGKVCDGVGVCSLNTAGIDCAPQKCVNGACARCVTEQDCLDPNASYCDGGGVCQPRKAQGASCTASAECLSTFCVDGVCCAEVCDKGCEWCGDPNAPGVCEAAPKGPPKSGRPACSGTGSCGAQCDGTKRDGCVYPGSATTCGAAKCQGDWVISAGTCDSSGGCTPGTLQDCGNYSCASPAGSCKTSCTTKLDCRLGAVCDTSGNAGTCNASGAACQGAYNVKASDGTVSSCNGYRCVSGACQQQCGSNADCGTGYVCAGSSCVVGTADGGTASGGASGSGGAASTGGASATGGATSGGGTSATGGAPGAGGAAGRDGGSATGGASAGTGARAGTGGTTAPDAGSAVKWRDGGAKAGAAASGDNGACGCRVPKGGGGRGTPLSVAVLALGIAAMRRRSSRSRSRT
jgi:hypothetical protein